MRHAIKQVLYDSRDPTSLLERLSRETVNLIPAAEGAGVYMVDAGQLRTMATSGELVGRVGDDFALEGTLAAAAVAHRIPLRSDDTVEDPRIPASLRRGRTRSAIAAPLIDGERVIGVLGVLSPRPAAFNDADLETVARICGFAGTAVAASLATTAAARAAFEADITTVGGAGTDADQADATGASPPRHRGVGEFIAEVTCPGEVAVARSRRRVNEAIAAGEPRCAVQPVIRLADGELLGAEALARFSGVPRRGPDVWFAEAHRVGLGIELEAVAVRRALEVFDVLPELPALSINVTHDMLVSGRLPGLLEGRPGDRLFLELTEHVAICEYGPVRRAVDELRREGVRLAIDDVGAGYSCFRHIVELEPECIKLDRTFIEGVEVKRAWAAMARALIAMAAETGTQVIAEGIETPTHLSLARELGAACGQGYLIARPCEPETMPFTFEQLPSASAVRVAA